MNSTELAQAVATPLGTVGMSFYFDGGTVERGKAIDLDVVSFYALGRGGVLRGKSPDEIGNIFFFFRDGAIASMVRHGLKTQTLDVAAPAHLLAADGFAHRTFGALPLDTLRAFNAAAAQLVASAPHSRWPIFDGYREAGVTGDVIADAYRYSMMLRELRGGVHTDAVIDAGLTAAEACATDQGGVFFALHGFQDEDRPDITDELLERRAAAEADTTLRMAELMEVLSDAQREALHDGAVAMHAALKDPVPVS